MNGDPSVCNGCGLGEPEVRFNSRIINGKKYRQHLCSKCHGEYKKKYPKNNESSERSLAKTQKRLRELRASGTCDEIFIHRDCKGWDKKRGLDFDLTVDEVRIIIGSGCSYCGESEMRIGLDRIDNSKGHTKDNVVAACIRCNYLRRDMPHKAWVMLVPSVRAAREAGVFGEWDCFGRNRNKLGESTDRVVGVVC